MKDVIYCGTLNLFLSFPLVEVIFLLSVIIIVWSKT